MLLNNISQQNVLDTLISFYLNDIWWLYKKLKIFVIKGNKL